MLKRHNIITVMLIDGDLDDAEGLLEGPLISICNNFLQRILILHYHAYATRYIPNGKNNNNKHFIYILLVLHLLT